MSDVIGRLMSAGFPLDFISSIHDKHGIPYTEMERAISVLRASGMTTGDIMREYKGNKQQGEKPCACVYSGGFSFYTLGQLTEEEKKPPEFIVQDLIPCGLSIISGAPKIRKSFLALQVCAAVANGTPILGKNTRKCDVAYFDLEGSKSRIAARAGKMSAAVPDNVLISNTIPRKLADGLHEDIRRLHSERPSLRLFIIDTYSRARGVTKTAAVNAYDADVALLEPLQRMAIEQQIAVVLIHHDRKGAGTSSDTFERLSGTMGISGSADSVINLSAEGKRFEGKAVLDYTPRDTKGGQMCLQFNDFTCEWQQIAQDNKAARGNPVCAWLLNHSPAKGAPPAFFPYSAIANGAYRYNIQNAYDVVKKAVKEYEQELINNYRVAVQIGAVYNGQRGIRIINLQ